MSPRMETSMSSFATRDDVTTINYALDWPHLENPSNTTFAGLTQVDICHCQKADVSPQEDTEPGHMYTRFECAGPEVRFKTEQEDLWVLEAPRGPINVLRPATDEEQARRQELHTDATPIVYRGRTLIFLSGPCPRGRYQAYATRRWLETLSLDVRQYVSSLCMLIQPYEEDCSDEATRLAYAEFAKYLSQHVPALQTLYLHICLEAMNLCIATGEFGSLLRSGSTKIAVVDHCWTGETKEYTDASEFLDAMTTMARRWSSSRRSSRATQKDRAEDLHGAEIVETVARGKEEEDEAKGKEGDSNKVEVEKEEDSADGDWTDATISPTSPSNETDQAWQLL